MTTWATLRRLWALGGLGSRTARIRIAGAIALGMAGGSATVLLLAGSGYVVDRAALRPGLGAIAGILAGVEVVAFLRGPMRYGERLVGHDVAMRSQARYRVWLWEIVMPRSPGALRWWRRGDLLARATSDVDIVADLVIRGAIPVATAAATGGAAVALIGVILPAAGAIMVAGMVAAMTVATVAGRRAGASESSAATRGRLAEEMVELVDGVGELVAFGAIGEVARKMEGTASAIRRSVRRRASVSALGSIGTALVVGATVVGIIAVSASAIRAGSLSPVMIAVLPLAAIGGFETIPSVGLAAVRLGEVLASGRRLLDVEVLPLPVPVHRSTAHLLTSTPNVRLTSVRSIPPEGAPRVLESVDVDVGPGRRVAVMGPSGSGKTTLVHLLLRFLGVDGGEYRLDGVDVGEVEDEAVRRAYVVVAQDARLVAGTIRENLAVGRPGASDADLAAVLSTVHLDAWIASLPGGLATEVGEGGLQVSGGERRRLAIARALLADGHILLLDEPTAGLDAETAEAMMDDIWALWRDRPALVVTHRQRDAAHCSETVRLVAGRTQPVRR